MQQAIQNNWQSFAATSIGKAHIDSHLPNQDTYFLHQDDHFSVAVVCDGAGSAKFSELGANYFSESFGQLLVDLARSLSLQTELSANLDTFADLSVDNLTHRIGQIREQLVAQIAADSSLSDYHATVTAILLFHQANQALLLQIGDSPAISSRFEIQDHHIDYFADLKFFGDDNKNEYVNETHFITQDSWRDNLRFKWIDLNHIDLIALMSDGCADLVLQGASQTPTIYRPFFGNVVFNLCASQMSLTANQMLEQAIADPATYRLTGDDKSLIVLLKNKDDYLNFEPMAAANLNIVNHPDSIWHKNQLADNVDSANGENNLNSLKNTLSYSSVTQQANLPQTSLPLPPATAVSDNKKQRRNTAVLAGTATLIGAGILSWVHFHRGSDEPKSTQNSAVASQTNLIQDNSQPSLDALKLSDPAFIHPLIIDKGNASPDIASFNLILAMPKNFEVAQSSSTSQPNPSTSNQAVYKLIPKTAIIDIQNSASNQPSMAVEARPSTVQPTNSTQAQHTTTSTLNTIKVQAKPHCNLITTAEKLALLKKVGITIQPNWQYLQCQIQVQPVTALKQTDSKQTALFDPVNNEWQLINGIATVFDIKPISKPMNKNASATLPSTLANGLDEVPNSIQVFYLSNSLNSMMTKSDSTVTASQPDTLQAPTTLPTPTPQGSKG